MAIAVILLVGQFAGVGGAVAAEPPTISVNGEPFETSHPLRILEGRALAPIEDLAALAGGEAYFDPTTGLCRYVSPTVRFVLITTRSEITGVDVQQPIPPCHVQDGQLFVPIRLMAEIFDWTLDWDSENQVIRLEQVAVNSDAVQQHNQDVKDQPSTYIYEPTPEEMDLFLRLISAEAWGEGLEGKLGVAAVVINSIFHPNFPDNMYDVITQPGRFSVVKEGTIDHHIVDAAYEAADRALRGEDPTMRALYFYNPSIASAAGRKFHETLCFTVQIGNHRFSTLP
ncbi:MAG: cell wall hydrolase [Bacillota bacterium]